MRIFVEQGSIYNPGWHILRENSPRNYTVMASFDTEAEATEELPYIQAYYEEKV